MLVKMIKKETSKWTQDHDQNFGYSNHQRQSHQRLNGVANDNIRSSVIQATIYKPNTATDWRQQSRKLVTSSSPAKILHNFTPANDMKLKPIRASFELIAA
uniref:Uncharacterized protein n=1 Tax=Romanomermis culicivorax TaxID=13658 RepID=A0A915L370_ROMCU